MLNGAKLQGGEIQDNHKLRQVITEREGWQAGCDRRHR